VCHEWAEVEAADGEDDATSRQPEQEGVPAATAAVSAAAQPTAAVLALGPIPAAHQQLLLL
jgi:hypothetical protein